jgi:hyaluronan synthase
MYEEAIDDMELEGQQAHGLLLNLKLLKDKADPFLIFFTIISSALILLLALKLRIFTLWSEFLQSNAFLRISTYPFLVAAIVVIAGLVWRTIIWFKYKPITIGPEEELDWPFLSVLMPAFNEEELITKAIDSVLGANYPQDKLELICINDGSSDLTLYYMKRAQQRYGARMKVINFPKNQGKRRALYAGVKRARGSIMVTVDSDSKIARSALRNIILPMIRDERVGAVSGRVAVLNEKENFLTRMLSIRYSVSFDFGRGYQDVFGTVICTPGALSAYRASVLKKFIHEWVNQKFMDLPCTYGEDRGLTTFVLKMGYMTRYQTNAVVYTHVPPTFSGMNKMYLRWTRSFIRESILFARFMFKPYRKEQRVSPILDFFFMNFLHPFHVLSIFIIFYSFVINPLFIIRHFAFLIAVSFFLSLYYLRTNKSLTFLYGIPFGLITAFFLWWIVPYAALTMKNRSWLTK